MKLSYRFFMTSTTPRKMMTKSRMPAMTPAIFTVWSVCFSGSTASGFRVAAPGTGSPDNHGFNESHSDHDENTRHEDGHVTYRTLSTTKHWWQEMSERWFVRLCLLLIKQVSISRRLIKLVDRLIIDYTKKTQLNSNISHHIHQYLMISAFKQF